MSLGIVSGIIGLFFVLISAAISLACLVFWICMLVSALTNKRLSDVEKLVWVLVIIFIPFLGSIIYFFVGRNKT
jgi:uncharacterized membrane protein YhaH (DUF805 family)